MKVKLSLVALSAFATMSFATAGNEINKKIESLPMFQSVGAEIINVKEIGSLYQIRGVANKGQRTGFDGFITKDLETVVLGKAFNANNGKEFLLDLDTSKLKDSAVFKRGSGAKVYFLFTDPECPYCIDIEKEIKTLKEDVTLYTILFPLDFHKNARNMSYYVLNNTGDDARAKAFSSVVNKGDDYKKAAYTAEQMQSFNSFIDDGINIAEQFGVSGTPTLMNAVGHRVDFGEIIKKQ
ncbi:MAG: thioredoxin fold domain-containing protein [Campylobacterales bacterium]|nr:thioredoxin fold domain-containing protein [Campylobacterales bacterium]